MRVFVTLLLCLTANSVSYGWSPFTHRLIAQESLKQVAKKWKLEEPVTITTFDDFLKKFGKIKPEVQNREDFAKWLKINPNSKFDQLRKEEKIGGSTTPIRILGLYSPKPDDGRDMYLLYDKWERFWFGSGTKTASQAFRHMEKPPFDLLDPLNTFGFPLGSIGQASQRAQIYFDLAIQAHRLGEPYWAWNFLGCGLHHLQDLQQPYHSAQLLPPLAWEGVKAYFQWGRKEKWGLIKTVTHITANTHHYFEGYVDHLLFLKKQPTGELWVEALRGDGLLEKPSSTKELAKKIRDFSNHSSYQTARSTFKIMGRDFLSPRTYDIGEEDTAHPEDPTLYLNPNSEERTEAASELSKIMLANFAYQGKAMRTVIRSFLDRIETN